jgi:HEAT repeat protein
MLEALMHWPREEAIPLLLVALEGKTAATRRQAADQLQAVWPAAAELSPHASRETLSAEAARLREIWQRDYGAEVAQQMANTNAERRAPGPASEEVVALIERLGAESIHDRRMAARELALEHAEEQLPEATLLRLRELVEMETDTLVWNDVLEFISHDGRAAAADLAAMAASHPSGDVRRRACGYFGRHPGTRAAEVLLNSLNDIDPTVVREAVRSLGRQPRLSDVTPLEAILTSPDSALRLEAAASLSLLGSPHGARALLRLTHHPEPAIRRQAATALGDANANLTTGRSTRDVDHQEVIAELTRLLNDRGDVRRAAQASLQAIENGSH